MTTRVRSYINVYCMICLLHVFASPTRCWQSPEAWTGRVCTSLSMWLWPSWTL